MELVKKEVYLPKASASEGAVLAKVYLVAKKVLADGWQAGSDASPLLAVVLSELLPAMKDVAVVGVEAASDPIGVAEAFVIELCEALRVK